MSNKAITILRVLLFHMISLSLVLTILLYRADLVSARAVRSDPDDPALVPVRSAQVSNDDDDDDDDDALDPPTDDDGTNDDAVSGSQTFTYTVRQGDNLWRIARYLGVPLSTLTAQTDTPSLIFPGQEFTYVSEQRVDTPPAGDGGSGGQSQAGSSQPAQPKAQPAQQQA